ncbi:MAG: hypothetical protein RIK87_26485 [Fuerstiella sp.]
MNSFSTPEDDNPYAVPDSATGVVVDHGPSGRFVIDGSLVRIDGPTQFPEMCIVTGQREDLVRVSKTLTYVSPILIIAFLLSGLIAIILYFLMRKQCTVDFYISRSARWSFRRKVLIGVCCLGLMAAVIVGLIDSGLVDRQPWLMFVPLILFATGLILIVNGANMLSVRKYVAPGQFWLKGFREPFLTRLRQNLADGEWPEGFATSGF